jgi:hypothetical protein
LLPETALDVKLVLLPSPQLMVPAKSAGVAPVFASVKVALRLVGVTPSTPPLALADPAVRAASATVTWKLARLVSPLPSRTVTVTVYGPSSA